MASVLITGASSGIGLAFARAYAERGWTVTATCRDPQTAHDLAAVAAEYQNVTVARLDVTDAQSVGSLAASLAGASFDIVLNNAGVMGPPLQRQRLGSLDFAAAAAVFDANCLGALRVAEAFRSHLAAGEQRKMVCVSSGNGSIALSAADPQAGLYFYRASKAALNVVMAAYAQDCAADGISVLLLSPGLVDSNFANGSGANLDGVPLISPADSVAHLIPLIDRHRGGPIAWLRYTGETVPW